MSELVNNLQEIYNIKLQIKDVLDTESDLFSDYPDLIEAAIGEGGGSSADPFYDYTTSSEMIMNEESSADYVLSSISDNFDITFDENDENVVEAVEWDENAVIDVEGTDVDKVVHVIVNGDPHEQFAEAEGIAQSLEDYSDLYGCIFPILENVTLTASEDPSNDGYDYLLEGDLYAWNLVDIFTPVVEITENGFYSNDGYLGFDVNVPSGGLSEGTFNIFNFLAYGLQYGMVEISNKSYEDINLYNLGPVNYIDPTDGMETKNQKVDMTLWDNSQMDTEVEFENVYGDATSNGANHWYQFNELSQSSDADEFMAVQIVVSDWVSNIDPETGIDSGDWEVSDTYIAAFENTYEVDGSGAWTYTICFYYGNNEYVVDLYQNGILVEAGVSAFVQQ